MSRAFKVRELEGFKGLEEWRKHVDDGVFTRLRAWEWMEYILWVVREC